MQNKTSSFFPARTQLRAGNSLSDTCYSTRNRISVTCGFLGWPQDSKNYPLCNKQNNENYLRKCLSTSGEPDWWKAFPECTDSIQCDFLTPPYTEPHT